MQMLVDLGGSEERLGGCSKKDLMANFLPSAVDDTNNTLEV